MPAQTNYNLAPSPGFVGQVAEMRETNRILSYIAQGSVPVGLLCMFGSIVETGPSLTVALAGSANPGTVIAYPTGISDNPLTRQDFAGVPIYESSRAPYGGAASGDQAGNSYLNGDPVPVLYMGTVFVQPEVQPSNQKALVYVRVAANGTLNVLGGFSAAPGTGLVLAPSNFVWASGPMANGLAILELT